MPSKSAIGQRTESRVSGVLVLVCVLIASTCAFGQGSGHRFWRVNVPSTGDGNYVSCAKLALHSAIGGADVAIGGTAMTGSNYDSINHPASYCFDTNASTWWASALGLPGWVGYDFGSGNAVNIVEFQWTARNDCCANQSPSSYFVQFSDDGATWTTYWVGTSSGWSLGQSQTFSARQTLAVSKANTYAVLTPPTGISVSKTQGYAVLTTPTGVSVSKTQGYAVLTTPTGVSVSKAQGYAVLATPPGVSVSKALGYAVILSNSLQIFDLSPSSGVAGQSIYISGQQFGLTQGSSTVTFNGVAATPTRETLIKFSVFHRPSV